MWGASIWVTLFARTLHWACSIYSQLCQSKSKTTTSRQYRQGFAIVKAFTHLPNSSHRREKNSALVKLNIHWRRFWVMFLLLFEFQISPLTVRMIVISISTLGRDCWWIMITRSAQKLLLLYTVIHCLQKQITVYQRHSFITLNPKFQPIWWCEDCLEVLAPTAHWKWWPPPFYCLTIVCQKTMSTFDCIFFLRHKLTIKEECHLWPFLCPQQQRMAFAFQRSKNGDIGHLFQARGTQLKVFAIHHKPYHFWNHGPA